MSFGTQYGRYRAPSTGTISPPCAADALDWYEGAVASEYEIAVGPRLGPGPEDAKEARVLNRVITWHSDRVECEADPRQAERLIDECGFN